MADQSHVEEKSKTNTGQSEKSEKKIKYKTATML
jgi:hypothetical protein